MKDFDRNYGLPQGEPVGVPVAKMLEGKAADMPCPNCGCNELMEITVEMNQPLLKGGKGKGTYIGCPACPFASPCMVVSGG
tara:strand:- start:38931 stop:39173 length:243 start_codon:yes stop_codon:yes gene_type:complete